MLQKTRRHKPLSSMLSIFVILLTILMSPHHAQAKASAAQIPLAHFQQMPMVEQPMISPDGKNIVFVLNQGEFAQVAVTPFNDSAAVKVLLRLGSDKYRIEDVQWANNGAILVSVSQPFKIDQIQVRSTHLYSATIDGSKVFEIRKNLAKNSPINFYRNSPHILSLLDDEPNHILVTIRDPRDNNYSSVYKVNITNGDFEKYLANSLRITRWAVTKKGEVLLAIGVDENPDKDINYVYTRKDNNAEWQLIKTIEAFKSETFSPVLYDPQTNIVTVLSDHAANETEARKTGLWLYDINTGAFKQRIGEAPNGLDVTSAITRLEGDERKVIGFRYNDNFIRYQYFDQTSGALALQVQQLFAKQGLQATLYHWDKARKYFLIYAISDKNPGKFYTFNAATKKIMPWYGTYPDLEKATLASVQPFEFEARDGMKLHAYITRPPGAKNPPVVVFPHGGPFVRDNQYFDPFVQMFASRGYAVLQVNYRGSTGYGNAYKTAGYFQWGKGMQTDLHDALAWLKASELADTDNACIVGASYGGYAALAAGYQTPERFKCIISLAGISDLEVTVRNFKMFGHDEYVKNAVPNDPKEMRQLSPIDHIDAYKAPVLLIHGKVDTVVRYEQSENMYEALKKAGKTVEYERFDYGTHFLDDASNRHKATGLMMAFLEKHLPVKAPLAKE